MNHDRRDESYDKDRPTDRTDRTAVEMVVTVFLYCCSKYWVDDYWWFSDIEESGCGREKLMAGRTQVEGGR